MRCRIEIAVLVAVVFVFGMPSMVCATLINSNSIIEYDIEYYIQTDKSVYQLGEEVEMLYRVTNVGEEDVTIPCSRSGEFNLWVQQDGDTIWALAHWFQWFSPGIELLAGESIEMPYSWDMIDDNDILVEPGIYNVVGVMYNEPWNYDNGGTYAVTEVGVPVNIVPEPATVLLLAIGIVGIRSNKRNKSYRYKYK